MLCQMIEFFNKYQCHKQDNVQQAGHYCGIMMQGLTLFLTYYTIEFHIKKFILYNIILLCIANISSVLVL